MNTKEQKEIREKIFKINPKKWWGDNFDVRFYLISKLKNTQNKKILDLGGGIGIILSEINNDNLRINLDVSFDDLLECKIKNDKNIQCVNAHSTKLPFKKEFFDIIVSGSVLEYNKEEDIKNRDKQLIEKSSVQKTIEEINSVLKNDGILYLTTPNNLFFKSTKLFYHELELTLKTKFNVFSISLFNTHKPRKNKFFNFSRRIPQIKLIVYGFQNTIESLLKKSDGKKFSKSFFVEAKK